MKYFSLAKKLAVVSIVIIIVLVSIVFYVNGTDLTTAPVSELTKDQSRQDALSKKIDTKIQEVETAVLKKNAEVIKETKKELKETLGTRAYKMYELSNRMMAPIQFYGKVVDQNNLPVSGVKINYKINASYFSKGSKDPEIETDQEGVFKIEGSGQSISIYGIKHKEITDVIFPNQAGGEKQAFFSADIDKYSVDNPYTVPVWRAVEYEEVVAGRTDAMLSINGDVVTFVFNKRRHKLLPKDGVVSDGIISLSCKRGPYVESGVGDWEVTVQPIDGGIQATDDMYLNTAPMDNYVQEVKISVKGDDPDFRKKLNKKRKYYFLSQNKKIYGSAILKNISVYNRIRKDHCAVSIDYKYTENGSRNLAVKQDANKIRRY